MTAQLQTAPETTAPAVLGDLTYSSIPAGITRDELHRYRVGFDRGARSFTRKHGGPGVVHDGDAAPAPGTAARRMLANQLAERGREYRTERHTTAHKAGMAELRKYVKRVAPDRLTVIVDPLAPTRKMPAPVETPAPAAKVTRKLAPRKVKTPDLVANMTAAGRLTVVHVDASPATEPAPDLRAVVTSADIPDPARGRRATRRALAAALRAAGIAPAGEPWTDACALVGLSS